MVLLNSIPLIVIDSIDRLKKSLGLYLYKYTVYKVNYSEKIICFIEKNQPEKNSLIVTMLWKNEYDVNPYHQINIVNFVHLKNIINIEILIIEQYNANNFEIRTPSSINRYVYNLNTHLFKQYEIIPGKIYKIGINEKTEMVYYKVTI
jgi:hypothetical protein